MKVLNHNVSGEKAWLAFDSFAFHGGEQHVRFTPEDFVAVIKVEIFTRLTDSANVMQLMIAVDAIKRMTNQGVPIELVIPYFPYARQDRVCVEGEALGAAVMANVINGLNFSKVTIWDAHSDVSPALLNRVVNVPQVSLLSQCPELCEQLKKGALVLISPDAGATKKTLKIAEQFEGAPEVIQAQKVRDVKTGRIVKTEILGDVTDKKVLIADDICDGGRTFIELAKVLKMQGATEVSLFITHGIFSKGLSVFSGLIDHIYTTDSFREKAEFEHIDDIQLTILEM